MPHRTQSWSCDRTNTYTTGPTANQYWQYNNQWDDQSRQDFDQTTALPDNTCLQPQSYYSQPPSDLQGPYGDSFASAVSAPALVDASVKQPSGPTAGSGISISPAMTTSKRPRLDEVNNNAQVWQRQRRNTFSEAQPLPFPDQLSEDLTPELEHSFNLPSASSCQSEASSCVNGNCTHTSMALAQQTSAGGPCFDFTFRAQQLSGQYDHVPKLEPGSSLNASPEPGQHLRAPALLRSQSESKDSSPAPELKEFDRKRAHSAVERKYRGNLNSKIESLRVVLSDTHIAKLHNAAAPSSSAPGSKGPLLPPGSKKADVLTNAIYYVQEAEASRTALLREIAYLKERALDLEKRMQGGDDCEVLNQLASMKMGAMGGSV